MCSCFRHPLFQLLRMKNLRLPTIIILLFFGMNIITFYFSICKVKVKNLRSEFVSHVRLGFYTMWLLSF